jgi:hypothetical protein
MLFKRGKKECFKCGEKYPEVFECCPTCYPSDVEMSPLNITIMVIIFIVLGYVVYYAW